MHDFTPVERFEYWTHLTPDAIFLRQPKGSHWHELSFQQASHRVNQIANYLQKFPAKSRIAIYSLNCADWIIADLAILKAGHISVPIYPTAGSSTIQFIVGHADIQLAFIGKLFECNLKPFKNIECISIFDNKENLKSLEDIYQAESSEFHHCVEHVSENLASIIYTSGTTGNPKGVMISNRAITNALNQVEQVFAIDQNDRFFSYLPLAHVAERMAVEMASIYFGCSISFVESLDYFAANLRSVKPTIFFAVPRIWLKLKDGVEAKLGGEKVVKFLFSLPILGKWLKNKLKDLLGFSNTRLALSGAASLSVHILDWFDQIGMPICEAYGLSETCGFSHINLPEQRKVGTVGKTFPGAECEITDSGEILLRNASLMDGYFNEPELTHMAIQDGWFRTGDMGKIDNDGFLTITGRVKELFKTSKGKYIAPLRIEQYFHPLISVDHFCVLGSNLPYPVLITSVVETLDQKQKKALENQLVAALDCVNSQLEKHEQIKVCFIVNQEWNTENNLMTPTLKIRRQAVEEEYNAYLEKSTSLSKGVHWIN